MEERIASPAKTIEILQSNDFQFLKKYGQNFLIDLHVLDKIIRAADVQAEDVCVEIGPGIGSLTQALAEHAREVIAVEIDDRLIPILQESVFECNIDSSGFSETGSESPVGREGDSSAH